MSRFEFKNLEKYKTGGTGDELHLSMPLPQTPKGKVLRRCPNTDCQPGLFQVGDSSDTHARPERCVRAPKSAGTTCPYCAHSAADREFTAKEDTQAALEEIMWAAATDFRDALGQVAQGFNQRQRGNGPISIKMTTQHQSLPRPVAYREDLLRDLACDCCGRKYGVFAIALHCPDCAAPNLLNHFRREVELIELQLGLSEQAKTNGNAELSSRLLGNAHEDVLTAFETYLKVSHSHIAFKKTGLRPKAQKNRFQNIRRAKAAFAEVDLRPFETLTDAELATLAVNIEKRHVVGHNLGLVDEHFLSVSQLGEAGKTLEISVREVATFAVLCGEVVGCLDDSLPRPTL